MDSRRLICWLFLSFAMHISVASCFVLVPLRQHWLTAPVRTDQQQLVKPLQVQMKAGGPRAPAKGFENSRRFAVLPAGTLVKHGTTSDVLPQILSQGLSPSGSISSGAVRDVGEKRPTTKGVYVAKSYAASATALIAFTAKMQQCIKTGSVEPGRVPLPVVLNIRLQADCKLGIDEDYLELDVRLEGKLNKKKTSKRGDTAGKLWQQYGSGAIMRENGVPAEWIESVECPHVPTSDCLTRAFQLRIAPKPLEYNPFNPFGHRNKAWNKLPLVYAAVKERLKKDPAGNYPDPADFVRDGQSLQRMVDDVFKLAYAYLLTETDSNATSSFASMQKFVSEDELAVIYKTTHFFMTLGDGSRGAYYDPPQELCENMGIKLSGTPSDWATLDNDHTWYYAWMLFMCAQFFCDTWTLDRKW